MKTIRLSGHAREQMRFRGAIEQEVVDTITTAAHKQAQRGRLECRKDFTYGQEWNGQFYDTKQVRPIFLEEADSFIVVTVYVYYF